MSHPQTTAVIATQRCHELHRSALQARQIKQVQGAHGVRVVHRAATPQPRRTVWARIVTTFTKTATIAPAAEPKLA